MTFVPPLVSPDALRQVPANRILLFTVLFIAVLWAFAWGAHAHEAPAVAADLAGAPIDQRFVVDASTGSLDLTGIEAAPGEVVEFVLAGSAGAPHAFVLTGASPGSAMQESVNAQGDTVIRLRMPEQGGLAFLCTVPGHEGLHGNLVVGGSP